MNGEVSNLIEVTLKNVNELLNVSVKRVEDLGNDRNLLSTDVAYTNLILARANLILAMSNLEKVSHAN